MLNGLAIQMAERSCKDRMRGAQLIIQSPSDSRDSLGVVRGCDTMTVVTLTASQPELRLDRMNVNPMADVESEKG